MRIFGPPDLDMLWVDQEMSIQKVLKREKWIQGAMQWMSLDISLVIYSYPVLPTVEVTPQQG